MKIIALWGKHDSGKTNTIKFLRDILLKRGAKEEKFVGDSDFISVFDFQNKKVGVFSGGDRQDILEENFKCLQEYHCDVIICPSRTKGETVHYLENIALQNNKLIWVEKARLSSGGNYPLDKERDIINLIQAEILFEELKLQL